MLKIHVRYIFGTLIATLLYVLWINFGTGRSLSVVFVSNVSKAPFITDTIHVLESTQHSTKPIEPVAELLQCNYNINDFNDLILSITRALEFLQLYLTNLVVDAAVGTRVLQGQLQLILQNFSLPSEIRLQLEQLLISTTDISDHIMSHFVDVMTANDHTSSGERRLKQNLYWIESGSLWEMPEAGDWRRKNDLLLLRYSVLDDNSITFNDVDFSDECIGSVFENCAVPEVCFTLFLKKRRSDYYITHAILFLLLSKKKNCFSNEQYMENITRLGNPSDIMASFCAKILSEAKAIEKNGFHIDDRDLFTEQVLVCAMAGFQQFLQRSWLRAILSWQSKKSLGCFELPKNNFSRSFDEIYNINVKKSNRVKRYDYVISAGAQSCSTHFTGVAVACLGLHLRYLLEACTETFFTFSGSDQSTLR